MLVDKRVIQWKMREIQKFLLLQLIQNGVSAEPSYISALPRSKICGETSSASTPYGVINDDLTALSMYLKI